MFFKNIPKHLPCDFQSLSEKNGPSPDCTFIKIDQTLFHIPVSFIKHLTRISFMFTSPALSIFRPDLPLISVKGCISDDRLWTGLKPETYPLFV